MSMTSDGTVLEEPLNAGKLQLTADGGVMTIADKAVVTSSADETYWFKQDGNEVLGINDNWRRLRWCNWIRCNR